jgi:hypothetical protein
MIEYIKPANDRMNSAANKVETAASKVITTSEKVDSLTNQSTNRKKLK